MAIADQKTTTSSSSSSSESKVWSFLKIPFRAGGAGAAAAPTSTASHQLHHYHHHRYGGAPSVPDGSIPAAASNASVSSVARSILPVRRRLKLDPSSKLYLPYEPGKQARTAIKITNISKSHVAFKFQTTAPKSCFMRPPGAILASGESIIATVYKFVEQPENNEKPMEQKTMAKFKIMSLKVKGMMEYVPELFDEQKDQVSVEQILRVVFLDPERSCSTLEKLKRQLAEADAAVETRKKPSEDVGPRIIGEGLVIDEWKERRERYLARQQGEGVDSFKSHMLPQDPVR